MSARHVAYWDYDEKEALTCPSCGWSGQGAGNEEHYEQLFDVCCAACGRMLVIVSYPTGDETRDAAAAGNERARASLSDLDAREARLARAKELELKRADQLPPLDGPELRIDWDLEERDGEHWTVLRHGDTTLWRELAYYEGHERFAEVFGILRERYGSRLAKVCPTAASETYLYGDRLSAPQTIDRLNRSLGA